MKDGVFYGSSLFHRISLCQTVKHFGLVKYTNSIGVPQGAPTNSGRQPTTERGLLQKASKAMNERKCFDMFQVSTQNKGNDVAENTNNWGDDLAENKTFKGRQKSKGSIWVHQI